MKEIKFRARNAKLPKCWIYGYFVVEGGTCYIINNDGQFLVVAGTECQYTGLKDKNGKEIYFDDWAKAQYESVGGFDTMEGIIRMSPNHQLEVWSKHKGEGIDLCNCHSIEIIGNIHSNPISKKKKGKYVKK